MLELSREVSVTDCHIHYARPALMPSLLEILDQNKIEKCNIVCTPHPSRLSLVPDALHLKAHAPERVYVFGGLDPAPFFSAPRECGQQFARYVETLVEMGCDGVKMLEGKPEMRKTLPIPPFDDPVYAPYWARMEELGIPILFHVNDPEEFWDPARIPVWARQQGWFYGDGSFIHNETQYREVLNVLRRFPGLKVIFAHFFFLSNQLGRLGEYLDAFPNMHVDLTPGIEMYFNFAKNPEVTRAFFIQYQDRILYGTDIGAKALLLETESSIDPADGQVRVDLVRSFLEMSGPFELDYSKGFLFGKFEGHFEGIGLPKDVLEKVYARNFEKLAGKRPRPLNPEAIVRECERLSAHLRAMPGEQPGDPSVAEMVLSYFKGLRPET